MKNLRKIIKLFEQDNEFGDDILYAIGEKAETPEYIDILDMLYHDGYGTTKSVYEDLIDTPWWSMKGHRTMKVLSLLTSYFIARYMSENNESDFRVIDCLPLSGTNGAIALFIGKPIDGLNYTPNLFTIDIDMRDNCVTTLVEKYGGVCYAIPEQVTNDNDMRDKLKSSHGVRTAMDEYGVQIDDDTINQIVEFHNELKDVINTITKHSDEIYEMTKCDYKYAGKRLHYKYVSMRMSKDGDDYKDLNDMSIKEIQDLIDNNQFLKSICLNELKKDGNYEYTRNKCIVDMMITSEHQSVDEMLQILYPN